MNDCRSISRRVVLTSAALSLGAATAAAVASQAAAQQKISQAGRPISDYAEGRPTLRRLRQLPTCECMQIRGRGHQPERLVPAVCREDQVLAVTGIFSTLRAG